MTISARLQTPGERRCQIPRAAQAGEGLHPELQGESDAVLSTSKIPVVFFFFKHTLPPFRVFVFYGGEGKVLEFHARRLIVFVLAISGAS